MMYLSYYCLDCGAENSVEAILCSVCGQDLPLSLIQNCYLLLEKVGTGGFGAVYKAQDIQLGGFVAVKVIHLAGLSTTEIIDATETYNREVQLLSSLKHPSLPRIYEHFTDAQHWYVVMDFIEGKNLEELLEQNERPFSLLQILNIGIQLCDVLHYLHSQEPPIIFRDLKPANIMMTSDKSVYLIDFGVARRFKQGQERDTIALGSPGYAAPEQYGKAQTSSQSDIYSLGVVLHQLLTGRDPADNPFHLPSLAACEVQVPARLDRLITQMLQLNVSQRPTSVLAVREELKRIVTELTPASTLDVIRGKLPAPVTPVVTPFHGKISRRAMVVGGLLGLGGLVYGGIKLSHIQPQKHIIMSISSTPDVSTPYASPGPPAVQMVTQPYRNYDQNGWPFVWSQSGKRIAAAHAKAVTVWDMTQKDSIVTYTGHTETVNTLAFSPTEDVVASSAGLDKTIRVWNMQGRTLATFTSPEDVSTFCWSPDGTDLVLAGDVNMYLYRLSQPEAPPRKIQSGPFFSVVEMSWSQVGNRVALLLENGDVQVIDITSGSTVDTYSSHIDITQSMRWVKDDLYVAGVASASSNESSSVLTVWNSRDNTSKNIPNVGDDVFRFSLSPDGKKLVAPYDYTTLYVWDTRTGTALYGYSSQIISGFDVSWSPDGKYIAASGRSLLIWKAL